MKVYELRQLLSEYDQELEINVVSAFGEYDILDVDEDGDAVIIELDIVSDI